MRSLFAAIGRRVRAVPSGRIAATAGRVTLRGIAVAGKIAWRSIAAAGRVARRVTSAEARPEWLTRLPGNRFALAGLVGLAVLALYGVASFARPAVSEPPRPESAPITAATVVCPDPEGARISALTPPGRAPGRVQVPGTPVALTSPGTAWSTEVKKAPGPWTFGASGSLAAGLTVEQTSEDHGLAGLRCPAPASDLWFVGPGPADAEDVELSLTNVDDRPVSADLAALSPDGSIENVGGQGVTVGPHAGQVIHIGDDVAGFGPAAASAKLIALHVRIGSGRLAAAVRVRRDKGADWLPAGSAATRLVVPGVPSGKGRRRLLIAVPGRDQATVRVQVMSSDGTFAPGGQDTVQAAALAVTPFDLGLGGKPAGLRLISDRPVIAALVAEQGDDFAVTAATPALGASSPGPTGPSSSRPTDPGRPPGRPPGGLVADARDQTTLLLTAPDRPAVVRLTQVAAQGPVGAPQDVRVPAGRTAEVAIPPPGGSADRGLSIVPQPGSGPVYAARLLKIKGAGITLLPVEPARVAVPVPEVRDVLLP
jgi:hypothetical protein